MRPGLVVSSSVHVGLIALSIFGLTAARPLEGDHIESFPIELVTPSEFDQLTKGSRTSKEVNKPPQVRAQKVAKAEPEDKPPEPKEAKQEVKPPPPPPPPPEAKAPDPTPPAPPKQAEAKPPEPPKPPEPKAAPPQPVSEDALPKKVEPPKPEPPKQAEVKPPEPAEPKKPEVKEAKPVPNPPVKAPPPPKTAEKPKPAFSADKIAALLDKREPVRTASASSESMPTTTAGIPRGTAAKLSVSKQSAIQGAIRAQVAPCWSPPIGAVGAESMAVKVRFQLNSDGSLNGEPSVVDWGSSAAFQAAADSALRAVRRCAPLTLPPEAYEFWQDVQINFDPKDMLGG